MDVVAKMKTVFEILLPLTIYEKIGYLFYHVAEPDIKIVCDSKSDHQKLTWCWSGHHSSDQTQTLDKHSYGEEHNKVDF